MTGSSCESPPPRLPGPGGRGEEEGPLGMGGGVGGYAGAEAAWGWERARRGPQTGGLKQPLPWWRRRRDGMYFRAGIGG